MALHLTLPTADAQSSTQPQKHVQQEGAAGSEAKITVNNTHHCITLPLNNVTLQAAFVHFGT